MKTKETTKVRKIEVELTTVKGEYCKFDYFRIYELRYKKENGEYATFDRYLSSEVAEREKQALYDANICEVAWVMERRVYLN